MELLEYLYEKPPSQSYFHPRNYQIKSSKTLILGMPKCGITSIIIDFLSSLDEKNYLYLDLDDMRLGEIQIQKLNKFIKIKDISYLVIENYNKDFPLPKVKNIILSSHNLTLHLKDFHTLHVKGLYFEEFIAYQQRNFNTQHIFSLYSNSGTYPKSAMLSKYENKTYMQEAIKLSLPDPISQNLFLTLATNQAIPYSLFKAYNELKPKIKISKDKLYQKAKELEEMGLINFVEKFNSPRSPKKIYLNNFSLKNAITHKKDFVKRFENMIFCQLNEKEIFYTNQIHFYLPKKNQAIIAIPFLTLSLILGRFQKLLPTLKKLNIKDLYIITLNSTGKDQKEGIKCEILSFWDWALGL
ncbi:MAG: hypothetical protein CR967_01395 [Proteobacteria bacterium]|nr:MAG: hypothetical protein CR967_01395 [Pseudomonadota bacterium]